MTINVDGFGDQANKIAKYTELRRAARGGLPPRAQALLRGGHRPAGATRCPEAAAAAGGRRLRVTLRLPDPSSSSWSGHRVGKSAWAARVVRRRPGRLVGPAARGRRRGRARPAREQRCVRGPRPHRGQAAGAGLTTVIDSTGLERKRRDAWRALAERARRAGVRGRGRRARQGVRERNRAPGRRSRRRWSPPAARGRWCADARCEGFAGVFAPGPVELVPPRSRPPWTPRRASAGPVALRFGLQLSPSTSGPATTARARRGGARGRGSRLPSLWVMDHFSRSRRSAANGRTCSTATRRSATWPA